MDDEKINALEELIYTTMQNTKGVDPASVVGEILEIWKKGREKAKTPDGPTEAEAKAADEIRLRILALPKEEWRAKSSLAALIASRNFDV